jgi:hypothetical protein
MPDGSRPTDPNDPRYQRGYQEMYDYSSKDNTGGGFFGGVIDTVKDMMAAAEAGAFAVSPDVGQAVIKQLTTIQDQVAEMRAVTSIGGLRQQLGGGYATQIASFNTQVTNEGPGKLLTTFAEELEQLKSAVTRSIANYTGSDSGNRQRVERAGEGLQ